MKRFFTTVASAGALALAVSALLAISYPTKALAYSMEDYDTEPDEGDYLLDNAHGTESHVLLHIAVEPQYAGVKAGYHFFCSEGDFPDELSKTSGTLRYEFWTDQGSPAGYAGDLEMESFQFGIENGTYAFSYGGIGNNGAGLCILTPSLKACPDGLDEQLRYTRVSGRETVRLYALYGSSDWIRENAGKVEEYAVLRESALIKMQEEAGDTVEISEPGLTEAEVREAQEAIASLESEVQGSTANAEFNEEGDAEPDFEEAKRAPKESRPLPAAVAGGLAILAIGLLLWMSNRKVG